MKTAIEDLKILRNWVLGIIGFATTVATVLVQALNFRTEPTVIAVAGFASALVLIVILIQRSEGRQKELLSAQVKERTEQINGLNKRLDDVDDVLLDIQRSTLRTEINDSIARQPENHDIILKMAEKYFLQLRADWVETELFLKWVDSEEAAGRKVYIPENLLTTVNRQLEAEKTI